MEVDTYDPALVPVPFGLNNTGAICYLNSFLQVLAGCTSFTRAVLLNRDYMRRTPTGTAMLAFVEAYAAFDEEGRPIARAEVDPDISLHSAQVLAALTRDLRMRRPKVRFGGGQESADEAFMHLIDMMEPGDKISADARRVVSESVESPITRLFLHRYKNIIYCYGCKEKVSTTDSEYSIVFNLFHVDRQRDVKAFSEAVRTHRSKIDDYTCEKCKEKKEAIRVQNLKMIPEIIFCTFNIYGRRPDRYFPDRLELPGVDGQTLLFILVGQIDHSGTLHGGHYWAAAARTGGIYRLNDIGVTPIRVFVPTPETYIVAYHFAGTSP